MPHELRHVVDRRIEWNVIGPVVLLAAGLDHAFEKRHMEAGDWREDEL